MATKETLFVLQSELKPLLYLEEKRKFLKKCAMYQNITVSHSELTSIKFRGKELIREAMHSVFLYHAIQQVNDSHFFPHSTHFHTKKSFCMVQPLS